MEAVVPCVMDQVEKGGGQDGMAHKFPRFRLIRMNMGEILGDNDQILLFLTRFLNDSDGLVRDDVEILGNVLRDESLDVVHHGLGVA